MGSEINVNRPELLPRSRLNRWKALCLGCSTLLICRCLGTKQVGVPSSNGSEELYIRGHDGNPCHYKHKSHVFDTIRTLPFTTPVGRLQKLLTTACWIHFKGGISKRGFQRRFLLVSISEDFSERIQHIQPTSFLF